MALKNVIWLTFNYWYVAITFNLLQFREVLVLKWPEFEIFWYKLIFLLNNFVWNRAEQHLMLDVCL